MEKNKIIPDGYMTVGEFAKKMGVTVRTMQYYDKQGILLPSSESEGGRRLYTDKDVVKLHQILSMKHLGFSLDDIKNRLISLNEPTDVAKALAKQASAIREKMDTLSESLKAVEALEAEVLQMQTVNFKKYADIIVNLQMNNEFYWLIKHFDDNTLDHIRRRFDQESGLEMVEKCKGLQDEAVQLQKAGQPPESKQSLVYAKEFWSMIMEFTGGDMSLLPKLIELGDVAGPDNEWKEKRAIAGAFTEKALEAYFDTLDYNPLEEVGK